MKEKILKKGVLLPLIIGIVLAVAFSVFLHNTTIFQPFSDDTVLAYHDKLDASNDLVEKDKISDYSANDYMGAIYANDDTFVVRYMADYANSANAICFISGVELGKGVSYLQVNYSDVDKLMKADNLVVSNADNEYKYSYAYSKKYPSKQALLSDNVDMSKGLVLVYQSVEDYGLSSDYSALYFKEVA